MVGYMINWRTLLLVLMIAILAFLYQKTQNVDAARYNESVAKLRLLKQYDAQWSLDVLRSRIRINFYYDPLVEPLAQFKVLPKEILSIAKDFGVEDSAELRDAETDFQAAIAIKQESVERFKSSNAILHNSLAFLPIAVQTLHLTAKYRRPQDAALEQDADRLLLQVFEYDLEPVPELKQEVENGLLKLITRVHSDREQKKAAQIFAAHVRTALRELQVSSEQLKQIQAVPIDARINALATALNAGYHTAQNRVEKYRQYLFLYVGFIMALLVFFALRLVQSYSALNRSNNELIHINETLEQRVHVRTEALSLTNNELTKTLNTLQVRTAELAEKNQHLNAAGERVREELQLARSMQLALLPQDFPNEADWSVCAGMFPALELGGDFYDCFALHDGRYGIVIADVSGKGVAAAFFMAVSRTVLLDQAMAGGEPSEVLTCANELLCERNPMELFVTACYGIYNPQNGHFNYASAGHHPSLLRDISGKVETLPSSCDIALGLFPGMNYADHSISLANGDALLLYTDGVTEAFSVRGKVYGDARLHAWFSLTQSEDDPSALVSGLVHDVAEFVEGAEASDDLTCLVLCRKKEGMYFEYTI